MRAISVSRRVNSLSARGAYLIGVIQQFVDAIPDFGLRCLRKSNHVAVGVITLDGGMP